LVELVGVVLVLFTDDFGKHLQVDVVKLACGHVDERLHVVCFGRRS
jgi:hypothetical protein